MKVKQHFFERLDRLEAELRESLVPALQRTAAGHGNMLFVTRRTNPYPEMPAFSARWSSCCAPPAPVQPGW